MSQSWRRRDVILGGPIVFILIFNPKQLSLRPYIWEQREIFTNRCFWCLFSRTGFQKRVEEGKTEKRLCRNHLAFVSISGDLVIPAFSGFLIYRHNGNFYIYVFLFPPSIFRFLYLDLFRTCNSCLCLVSNCNLFVFLLRFFVNLDVGGNSRSQM